MRRAAGRVGDGLAVEDRSARSASAHGAPRDHDELFRPVTILLLIHLVGIRARPQSGFNAHRRRTAFRRGLAESASRGATTRHRAPRLSRAPFPYLINNKTDLSHRGNIRENTATGAGPAPPASHVADRARTTRPQPPQ